MAFTYYHHLAATRDGLLFLSYMTTTLMAGCWLLAFEASPVLRSMLLVAPPHAHPTRQVSLPPGPPNPFPRANSIRVQLTEPLPVAMERLVHYYQTQGYVVDTVDREVFFAVQAHTTLQLPQRPVRLSMRASFGGQPGTVCLRATYEHVRANGQVRPQPVRPLPAYYLPALLPPPTRQRQVRYTTWLAPARRAAFVEMQRVCQGAFPGKILTYANEVP